VRGRLRRAGPGGAWSQGSLSPSDEQKWSERSSRRDAGCGGAIVAPAMKSISAPMYTLYVDRTARGAMAATASQERARARTRCTARD